MKPTLPLRSLPPRRLLAIAAAAALISSQGAHAGSQNRRPKATLDGSQVLRVVTGMSWETYANFASFGFILVIIVIQIPIVRQVLSSMVFGTLDILIRIFGMS